MRIALRILSLSVVVIALQACAMVQSTSVDMALLAKDPKATVCESDAGAYYLPKTLIRVVVTRKADLKQSGDVASIWHAIDVQRLRVADKKFGFCLDYLARASSDDVVEIRKYKDAQLLGTVTTDAIDQSRTILRTLIQSVFVAISGNPQFDETLGSVRSSGFTPLDKATKEAIVFQAEFDPFDPTRSAIINDALNDFGFCILLDAHTFDAQRETINSYCDNPKAAQRRSRQAALEYAHAYSIARPDVANRETSGLFYRPRVPYNFYLFTKRNRQLPAGWQLRASRAIRMENISPILSVGLQRTTFSQRKTTLMFEEGMLSNVCIYKGSELEQFVQIPLQVAKSVVALPANIIQVRINTSNSNKELLAAEKQLIDWQTRQLQDLDNRIAEAERQKVTNYATGAQSSSNEVPEARQFKVEATLVKRHKDALPENAPSSLYDAGDSAAELRTAWQTICPPNNLRFSDTPVGPVPSAISPN